MSNVEVSECSDPGIILKVARAGGDLATECKTAVVLATSECPQDGHGIHVTCAVINKTGTMTPREVRALNRRLRSLADELESQFGSDEESN